MKKIIFVIAFFISVQSYTQQWQIIDGADMPLPVFGGEAVVVDSMIYIIGGFSDSLNINVKVIQKFNPHNNSWQIIDSMNASRYGFVAGNFRDSIFILGGIILNLLLDSSLELWNLIDPPYILDLKTDFIRTFATGQIHSDTLYVFGGHSISLLSTYMFEYSIADTTFPFKNNFGFLATYPFQQMSAYLNNSIYLFGGVFIGTSRVIYKYDIKNKSLDLLPTELMQSRAGGKAVSFGDSIIYIIGGFNESSLSLSSVEVFKEVNGGYEIRTGPPLNMERSELMAVEYNNSVYVFGGKNDLGKSVRRTEKLNFTTDIKNEDPVGLNNFMLYQNYPNPFNPSTNISFYLPSRSYVRISIYNIAGEEIFELVNGEMDEGTHNILFSANRYSETYGNKTSSRLSSGVYFYKLTAFNFSSQNTYIATRKMLLLK